MNEERAYLVNRVIEGRMDPSDAARWLDELAALEMGVRAETVEPDCPPLPWLASVASVGTSGPPSIRRSSGIRRDIRL